MTTPLTTSCRSAKKAKRKAIKAEKKRQMLEQYMLDNVINENANTEKQSTTTLAYVGGKASRARLAREDCDTIVATFHLESSYNNSNGYEHSQHRAQGAAPILSEILPERIEIVKYLEEMEQELRIEARGIHMKDRMLVKVDNHGSMLETFKQQANDDDDEYYKQHVLDLSNTRARGVVSLASIVDILPSTASLSTTILHLNLSRNELWDISAEAFAPLSSTLITLDISRNWFEALPEAIESLHHLKELRASYNLLKPNPTNSLRLDTLTNMKQLEVIDIRFNQKCGNQSLLELMQSTLNDKVIVKMTVTYPPAIHTSDTYDDRVGASPAVRDATLLRSQLEPWSTMALRRRLVSDFGQEFTPDGRSWADEDITRGQVMNRLLACYQEEASDKQNQPTCDRDDNGRLIVHVSGQKLDEILCNKLLHALKEVWASSSTTCNRERPSICADNYMILCSPSIFDPTSQKAAKAAGKLKRHQALWDIAYEALNSVDPFFASQYTAVAVTHNFIGSPHIDKQNCGPFYGLSLGNFEEGGNIMVECSARVLASVNTKNSMAQVDGRFPHWVSPYNRNANDRYSLIYYRTEGHIDQIGPAVFKIPTALK